MTDEPPKCPECGCDGNHPPRDRARPPPRVLNIKDSGGQVPPGAVYVARPTKWGNPYIIGKHGTRDEVIAKYREWLLASPDLLARLPELRGRDLVCFCRPLKCHADFLLELANEVRMTVCDCPCHDNPPDYGAPCELCLAFHVAGGKP